MTIRKTLTAGALAALVGFAAVIEGGTAYANDADVEDFAGIATAVVEHAAQEVLSDSDVAEGEVFATTQELGHQNADVEADVLAIN